MKTGETKRIPSPRIPPFRSASALTLATLALGAMLALSACSTKTRTVRVGDPAALQAAENRAKAAENRAEAAEEALADLHASLAAANAALGALQGDDTSQQRKAAREAVVAARVDLGKAQETLAAQPASAARTAADAALAAVDTALVRTAEALAPSNGSLASGAELANMHTSLDRAQAAVVVAQAELRRALAAEGITDGIRTALAQAQATLFTAQTSLFPLLDEELAQATTRLDRLQALSDARDALGTARDALRKAREEFSEAVRDLASAAAAEKAAKQAEVRVKRAALETAQTAFDNARDTLAEREAGGALGAWAAGTPLVRTDGSVVTAGTARVTRTPRTDTGEEGWAKLDVETDPVAYAAGKTVLSAGGTGTTDELPMRSAVLRAAGSYPIKLQGDDGSAPDHYRNTDGVVTSSLQLSEDGLTIKFGGEGLVYYDMQRTFDYFSDADGTPDHDSWWRYGPDGKLGDASASAGDTMTASHARDLGLPAAGGTLTSGQATALQGYVADNSGACWQMDLSVCGDWAHDDLTISLGRPSPSPDGEPAHYWKARIPFTAEQAVAPPVKALLQDTRPADIGQYEVWLSNHAGVDDKGTETEADDAVRYLDHAAYGLFMLHDNLVNEPSYVRPQAFAAGYDAFQDLENLRTTDVATSIAARFEGRTMARTLISRPFNSRADRIVITDTKPMRGDLTLNACIGGTGCTGEGFPTGANMISGMISNFERLRTDGTWLLYEPTNGGIPLQEAAIAVDGSFKGQVGHPLHIPESGSIRGRDPSDFVSNTGSFAANPTPRPASGPATGDDNGYAAQWGGNLYGPRNALEAAGWWHLPYDGRAREGGWVSIIGSFGAKCTNCD